jgi:hypothetical protein
MNSIKLFGSLLSGYSENGKSNFLQKVCNYLTSCTTSYARSLKLNVNFASVKAITESPSIGMKDNDTTGMCQFL